MSRFCGWGGRSLRTGMAGDCELRCALLGVAEAGCEASWKRRRVNARGKRRKASMISKGRRVNAGSRRRRASLFVRVTLRSNRRGAGSSGVSLSLNMRVAYLQLGQELFIRRRQVILRWKG